MTDFKEVNTCQIIAESLKWNQPIIAPKMASETSQAMKEETARTKEVQVRSLALGKHRSDIKVL
jgi:hypothetical protein